MNIADDIGGVFRKRNNTLLQLLVINILLFVVLIVVNGISKFLSDGEIFSNSLVKNISLNAPLTDFIRKPWTLFSYFFSHFEFWHIFSNMLFLFWFGSIIQEYIGSQKLLNLYLLGGVFGGLFYMFFYNLVSYLPVTNILGSNLVGASASVYAIMFAAITLLPENEFYFFGILRIKTQYLAWFFLLISFYSPASGIAHAGGAMIGYLYITLLRRGRDLGSPIESVVNWWHNLWNPKPKMTVSYRKYSESTVAKKANTSSNAASLDPNYFPDQDEVDAILDKIGDSGYESLTREEKQKLYRASQKKD